MIFTNADFVHYCKSMVGMPYWYGTCGYKCSEDLLKRKKNQYPDHYGSSRMSRYRQDISKKKVCQDCIGLIKGFFWTGGGQGILDYLKGTGDFKNSYQSNGMPDKSADGFLTWLKKQGCRNGTISSIPDVPGIPVFMSGHVGVYVGNGDVIEARGFSYGVVKTKLKDRKWKYWAYLPSNMIEYTLLFEAADDKTDISASETPKPAVTFYSKLGSRNLYYKSSMMTGDDVKELQEKLNALGYKCGAADGIFGKNTEKGVKAFQTAAKVTVDGNFGKNSFAALKKMLGI